MVKIFISKKVIEDQNYEEYWSLTLEYSDIYGANFKGCLGIIVNFIDKTKSEPYSSLKYEELQKIVNEYIPKADMASTRKSINQFVKLGFISSKLQGYPNETKEYLKANNKEKTRNLFSKIVYSYSSFKSSMSEPKYSREVNFFIQTLQQVESIDKEDLLALMTVDLSNTSKNYYTRRDIDLVVQANKATNFNKRKYNQVAYLWSVFKKLDGIIENNKRLYLQNDSSDIIDEKIGEFKVRDSYLQHLYKKRLKEEAKEIFGSPACMVSGMRLAKLIASHIKPFRFSNEEEEYDPNNGLLLSLDLDQLFDSGRITFLDNGKICFSNSLDSEIKEQYGNLEIKEEFLNSERKEYLFYHKTNIFIK